MKDPAFPQVLRAWQPDFIVVTAFGRILPQIILDLPSKGCVNVHGSLLPKDPGAGPIQWAVINGERETGITTMMMDAGMDTGAMLLQQRVAIDPDETAGSLSTKLAKVSGPLLIETLRRLKEGTLTPQPQDHSQATMAPLLKKEDGQIDWTASANEIANRIRGGSLLGRARLAMPEGNAGPFGKHIRYRTPPQMVSRARRSPSPKMRCT